MKEIKLHLTTFSRTSPTDRAGGFSDETEADINARIAEYQKTQPILNKENAQQFWASLNDLEHEVSGRPTFTEHRLAQEITIKETPFTKF